MTKMSDVDEWEQTIIDNAVSYSVVAFTPQRGSQAMPEIPSFDIAYETAKNTLEKDGRVRACMIYAVNEYNNHAMVGSLNVHGWTAVKRK